MSYFFITKSTHILHYFNDFLLLILLFYLFLSKRTDDYSLFSPFNPSLKASQIKILQQILLCFKAFKIKSNSFLAN